MDNEQNYLEIIITIFFLYTLKLSNQEKEVLNIYKDISKKEIENIIPSC